MEPPLQDGGLVVLPPDVNEDWLSEVSAAEAAERDKLREWQEIGEGCFRRYRKPHC